VIRPADLAGDLDDFIDDCRYRELSPDTIFDYRKFCGEFVRWLTARGVLLASGVRSQHVKQFLLGKQETCGAETLRHYYRDFRAFFNYLVSQKTIPESPLTGVQAPRAPKPLIKPFDSAQLQRLLILCDDSFLGLRNRAMILMFLDTWLRKKELALLQLTDVDFTTELVTVRGKGGKERYVRMGKRCQRALLRYLMQRHDRSPGLWVSEERRYLDPGAVYQMLRKLGKRAGLEGVRCSPHTLRHTGATMALENGAQERQVQELLGHSSAAMTKRYTATLQSRWAAEAHKKFGPVDRLGL